MKVFLSLLPVVMATEAMVTNPPGQCTAKLYPGHGTQTGKYKSLPASSASACCVLCQLDDRCGHFVYETPGTNGDSNNEPCHLKEGKNMTLNEKPRCTAGAPDKPAPTPAPTPPPIPPEPPVLGYKPHLIFFLGDDVGHYNMGWRNNTEARTPNMDQLVADGIILDRHYVYKYCSPTRSAFLSGRLPIHVNVKNEAPMAKGGVDVRMTMVASKLKSAGYMTHQVGKWNAGSGAWGAMPINRGFDSSYGYMGGEEDHYTQIGGYKVKGHGTAVDLWENDAPAYGKNGTYNAFHFTEHAVNIIQQHDPSTPLFLYQAWQEAHTPNEVPEAFLGPVLKDDTSDALRRTYEGMVHCLDSGIGNVTAALKAKGMWNRTLIVFSSDNGGREDNDFGGNNFPLRGMKFSDFEGGVRVTAFASGGLIPTARRGSVEPGLIHISDWYHTFCILAGVSPTDQKAREAELPPIDSQNVWPVVAQGAPSPHLPSNRPDGLVLSASAIIIWPYKLVLGGQQGKGVWTGSHHPNSTTKLKDDDPGCGGGNAAMDAFARCAGDYDCLAPSPTLEEDKPERSGCLFNIQDDPTEHVDLSALPAHADTLKALETALQKAMETQFQTDSTPGYDNCTDLASYVKAHRGFGGPLCYNGSIPSMG